MRILDERRGEQFGELLAAQLGRAGQPFDRHEGRTYADTLDNLVADGFRFIELRWSMAQANWDAIRDSIECIPDDIGADATTTARIAFLWASSMALSSVDYRWCESLGWITDSLMALEYDPEARMELVLVTASENAPARFRSHFATPPWGD